MLTFARASLLAALALALAACGSPAAPPALAPQFGTAADEAGVDVALPSQGGVYALTSYYDYVEPPDDWGYFRSGAVLQRYDTAGKLLWSREPQMLVCSDQENDCPTLKPLRLETNAQGYLYATYSYDAFVGDCTWSRSRFVERYDSSGRALRTIRLGSVGNGYDDPGTQNDNLAVAVDGSGNLYAARSAANVNESECVVTGEQQLLSKYNAPGSLVWQRTPPVGLLYGVTLNSAGGVYVIGSKGMARYNSSGGLVWSKTGSSYNVGAASRIVASGSNLYVRNLDTIRKYDQNGKLLWSRLQTGLRTLIIQDLAADSSGNVYLSGKFIPSGSKGDAFWRKLSSSGSTLWTKTFSTAASYDDAPGVAVRGSEVYVTGSTDDPYDAGYRTYFDGYLKRLSTSGSTTWTR